VNFGIVTVYFIGRFPIRRKFVIILPIISIKQVLVHACDDYWNKAGRVGPYRYRELLNLLAKGMLFISF
jgi:hypothetical protein